VGGVESVDGAGGFVVATVVPVVALGDGDGVEGACDVDMAGIVAENAVVVVGGGGVHVDIAEMRGWRGASDVSHAGSSVVKVKGVY
jgi:hypothetical protein